MSKVGGLTHKYYKETDGLKVSGGQFVKKGTLLTRNGDRWKPGANVIGKMHLNAACEGEVYFTKKRGSYRNRTISFIHVRPATEQPKKKAAPKPKTAKPKATKPAASKSEALKSKAKKTAKSKAK